MELKQNDNEIESHLNLLESYRRDLKKDPIYAKYAYVMHEDLENLSNKLLQNSEFENEVKISTDIYDGHDNADIEGQ